MEHSAASSSGSGALDRASGQREVGPAGNDGRSPDPDAANRQDFEATNKYALQPRTTETGRFYVVRREWELMFGKPVLNEYAHRVSPWLDSEFARIDFCTRYAKNNPGCVARAEDVIA